jgi:hypothetical protein
MRAVCLMRLCRQSQLFQLIDARSAAGQVPESRFTGKSFRGSCKFAKDIGTRTPDSRWIWMLPMEHVIKYSNKLTFHLVKRVARWIGLKRKPLDAAFPDTKLIVH